ncbi:unnamed protein product [Lota lota]
MALLNGIRAPGLHDSLLLRVQVITDSQDSQSVGSVEERKKIEVGVPKRRQRRMMLDHMRLNLLDATRTSAPACGQRPVLKLRAAEPSGTERCQKSTEIIRLE